MKNDGMIDAPGRLFPVDTGGILAGADVIYDDDLQLRQSAINATVKSLADDAGRVIRGVTKVVTLKDDLLLDESPEKDTQTDVLLVNADTVRHTVSVSSRNYRTPDGAGLSLTVPPGGYAEVNFLNVGGTVFVRGM